MSLLEFLNGILSNPSLVLLAGFTLVELSPIKINPWKWFGDLLFGEFRKELSELKRDFEETKADDMRWNILNFANSCRRHEEHSKDEWRHVMSQIRYYEEYTEKKNIQNGVIDEDAKYLRELYHERNVKNDFL